MEEDVGREVVDAREVEQAADIFCRGDVPALVRYVDAALYAIEGPTRRPALSGQPRLPLVRAPATGGAQTVQEVTDRLLVKLRAVRKEEA